MANQKFTGAIANQYYRWGYTCELCGREVEKRNALGTRLGSMHKTTTWVSTTEANAEAMKQQAALQLAPAVAQMDEKVKAGHFDLPQGEDGKCPFCKQYQHWSSTIRNQIAKQSDPKGGKGEKVGIGCLSVFLGALPGLFLGRGMVDVFKIPEKETAPRIAVLVGGIVLCILIVGFIAARIAKRSDAKLSAQIKALEKAEKKEPHFIAWAELKTDTTGMSVH